MRARVFSFMLAPLLVVALATCSDSPESQPPPGPEPWQPEPDESTPVSAQFNVTFTPSESFASRTQLQPVADPITVTGGTDAIQLIAHAHIDRRPDIADENRVWIELYVVNRTTQALKDVTVTLFDLTGAEHFYDHTVSPYADKATSSTLSIPRIAKEGIGHLSIAIPPAAGPISFGLDLAGNTTRYDAKRSEKLEVTADGAELWAPVPDADVVAIVDTATNARVAQIPAPGHPSAIGLTPDGEIALVVSAHSNEVRVVDRKARKVVQTLGEAEGIGREPREIVVSPDGAHAYVSAYVGDTITELERQDHGTYRVSSTLPVGRRPSGMSISPDSGTLLVSHFLPRGKVKENHGWVTVMSTRPLKQVGETKIVDDANDDSGNLCLADKYGISHTKATGMAGDAVPSQLSGVFLDPAGTEGWVPGMRFSGLPVWEGDLSKGGFGSSPIVTSAITFVLDTRDLANVREKLLPGVADLADGHDAFLRCAQPRTEFKAASSLKQGSVRITLASAIASAFVGLTESAPVSYIGFTRGGRRAVMLSRYADEVIVWDAITHHPTSQRYMVLSGSTPSGIAFTPDGSKAYVAYENETYASVLDTSAYAGAELPGPSYVPYDFKDLGGISTLTNLTLRRFVTDVPDRPPVAEVGQVPLVDVDPMDPEVRQGKRLFFSANPDKFPQQTASRKAGCAVCHADGGHDGAVWGTMEGERRTLSLRGGVMGRGWMHQSGTHADADEFVRTIVKERLAGKADVESDILALRRYLLEGVAKLQSPRTDAALVAKGQELFEARCRGCHAGPKYGSGNPDPASPIGADAASGPGLFDIGSATDGAGAVMGDALLVTLVPRDVARRFQLARGDRDLGPGDPLQVEFGFRQRPPRQRGLLMAPVLENVFDYVLFFHDGRASSLEEAVDDMANRVAPDLSADDRKALVEFLKTL